MPKALANALFLIALAAAAALTWYWGRPEIPVPETGAGDSTLSRGYYLRDAVIRHTDEDGEVLYEIHAGTVMERPVERLLALRDVSIVHREGVTRQWEIVAAEGEASVDDLRLALAGGVALRRDSSDGGLDLSLETERLWLDLERKVARTDAKITLRYGTNLVTAVGMSAFLLEDQLELESNVYVRVQP